MLEDEYSPKAAAQAAQRAARNEQKRAAAAQRSAEPIVDETTLADQVHALAAQIGGRVTLRKQVRRA